MSNCLHCGEYWDPLAAAPWKTVYAQQHGFCSANCMLCMMRDFDINIGKIIKEALKESESKKAKK